jgi:hypothetical protein
VRAPRLGAPRHANSSGRLSRCAMQMQYEDLDRTRRARLRTNYGASRTNDTDHVETPGGAEPRSKGLSHDEPCWIRVCAARYPKKASTVVEPCFAVLIGVTVGARVRYVEPRNRLVEVEDALWNQRPRIADQPGKQSSGRADSENGAPRVVLWRYHTPGISRNRVAR